MYIYRYYFLYLYVCTKSTRPDNPKPMSFFLDEHVLPQRPPVPSGESVRRDTRSGEDEKHMKTESIKHVELWMLIRAIFQFPCYFADSGKDIYI